MPKRTSTKGLDTVQNAKRVFDQVIQESESVSMTVISTPSLLSEVMSEMGRRGGKIGGKRRLKTLTPERRKEIAQAAAQTRWAKAKKTKKKST